MNFSEKLKAAREKAGYTQTKLAALSGVSLRTVQNWELGMRKPSNIESVGSVADVLGVNLSDLLSENDEFVIDAAAQFGPKGKKGAEKLLEEINGLFAGGELADEDKDEFMLAVQEAYILSKKKNKKYGQNK